MKEIQGNSFLVRVSEGSRYRQSITVMFLLVALLRMLRPKTLDIHVQLVIRTLTSPMGINLRNRSALVLELETKESFVSLITKLNNKTNV